MKERFIISPFSCFNFWKGFDGMRVLLLMVLGWSWSAWSHPFGDRDIDVLIDAKLGLDKMSRFDNTRLILNKDQIIKSYWGDSVHKDAILYLSYVREGVPYLFGGNDWTKGIDCSHFTMRIFQELGLYYRYYQSTILLKSIVKENGLESVPLSEVKFGDMLVYGFYDKGGEWNGHVVILLDSIFKRGNFSGLVVGAHGGMGVRFLSYKGFPHYYRESSVKLQNVLRLRDFDDRLNSNWLN